MNLQSEANVLTSVDQALSPYEGKKIYFEPLGGNNGDVLIEKGSLSYLNSIGIQRASNPENSEAIVINGGGAINDIWESGIAAVKKYSLQHPNIPLIILPSSFIFHKTHFPSLFEFHKAPVFLYAREPYSLNILKELKFSPCVQVGLDHDMAFRLEKTAFIQDLKSKAADKHILIVERHDFESATVNLTGSSIKTTQLPSIVKDPIPTSIKDSINKNIRNPLRHSFLKNRDKMGINTSFFQEAYQKVLNDYPGLHSLPIYAADISSDYYFSFKQFAQLVSESAVVVTTRLHVAILAAMLNKPTYVKTGSYHKIRGIFEYSLKDRPNFHLIDKL